MKNRGPEAAVFEDYVDFLLDIQGFCWISNVDNSVENVKNFAILRPFPQRFGRGNGVCIEYSSSPVDGVLCAGHEKGKTAALRPSSSRPQNVEVSI